MSKWAGSEVKFSSHLSPRSEVEQVILRTQMPLICPLKSMNTPAYTYISPRGVVSPNLSRRSRPRLHPMNSGLLCELFREGEDTAFSCVLVLEGKRWSDNPEDVPCNKFLPVYYGATLDDAEVYGEAILRVMTTSSRGTRISSRMISFEDALVQKEAMREF